MRIFHRRGARFQATALHTVAPQRRTPGDQAVMGIGERKSGQEGNRLAAKSADAAPNSDPVMVLVMSLFAPTAVTYDRILRANRAAANDYPCGSFRPFGLLLALRPGT